jgi:hypothetical protein
MAGEPATVRGEVAAEAEAPSFVERLGEWVGGRVTAAAVFGAPVEREGVTVIPVARAAWGFGGGTGEGEGQTGSGGGGGGAVRPIGYIEVRDGSAEFKPLRTGPPTALVAAAAIAGGLALARGIKSAKSPARG